MRLSASCCLLLAVFVLGGAVVHVEGAENPSYTAYALGKYMTARKLAEAEAANGSKEAYTLLGEIYSEGLGVAQDDQKAARSDGPEISRQRQAERRTERDAT